MIAIRWNRPFPNSGKYTLYIDVYMHHAHVYCWKILTLHILYEFNTYIILYRYCCSHNIIIIIIRSAAAAAAITTIYAVGVTNRPMFSISFGFIEYISVYVVVVIVVDTLFIR